MRVLTLLVFAITAVCGSVVFAEDGLVAHWPLDEGSGFLAWDVSGSGNHGWISGASWVEYGAGHMLSFDGINDLVNCGSGSSLDIRGAVTLSAWMWAEEVPVGEVGLAGKYYSSYLLTYYHNRQAYWYIGSGGNNASAGCPTGTWNHVAGTFDGTKLRIYLNGALVTARDSSFAEIPAGGDFFIGRDGGSGYFKGMLADVKVYDRVVSAAELANEYEAGIQGRFAPVPSPCNPIEDGVDITDGDISVRVGYKGGTQVSWNGSFCIIESTFSYPKTLIGTNAFSEDTFDSEAAWQPTVTQTAADTIQVSAAGAYYGIERTVRLVNGRVKIEDAVTNLRGSPVGILVSLYAITPNTFGNTRLGMGAEEPIVYMTQPEYDLGIFGEDYLTRSKFNPFATANIGGMRLYHFGLDTGGSHTLKFTVYPLDATGDPLDFINALRQDIGSNQTILGPAGYFYGNSSLIDDPEGLERYLRRKNLNVVMLTPWLDYDPGNMSYVMPREEYKAMMQHAYAAFKAVDPNIKVIGCIETDWVTIYPDEIEGGDQLPSWPEYHGPTRIAPELAQIIIDSGIPHVDSAKRTEDGGMWLECYGRGGEPQTALGVYPAPGNYQAWFLMDQAHFLVDEVGLDGWYIDEFSLTWIKSYEDWDGYTVNIDPSNGEIIKSYIDANLVGFQPRMDLMQYAADNNLVMVANTYASTTEGNGMPAMRFAETWGSVFPESLPATGKPPYMAALARSQVGTPIGLGAQRPAGDTTAELLMRVLRLYLRHGMVYFHYVFQDIPETGEGSGEYGPLNAMFPITPVRLFEGGIVGEERTVTCISGTYEWNHPDMPNVRVFDTNGRIKSDSFDFTVTPSAGAWAVVLNIEDWADIAVISGDGEWETRALKVQSTPISGVNISGSVNGATECQAGFSKGTGITLTAAVMASDGDTDYRFVRWKLIRDPGLVARYPLDEGTGDTAHDTSGFRNDALLHGGTWVQEGGAYALSFDGVDDYVDCGIKRVLDLRETISLSLWVNPDETPTGEVGLAGKGYGSFLLTHYHDHRSWWYIGSSGNSVCSHLPDDQWSHIVGTFDGAKLRLYRNGALAVEDDSDQASIPKGDEFLIGVRDGAWFFKGRMSDVKVYSHALSDEEIAEQHQLGRRGEVTAPQPDGQATITFTLDEASTAVAEYAPVQRDLRVLSTPVAGAAITASPAAAGGTTGYSAQVDDNSEVALTAATNISDGDTDYEFVQWELVTDLVARYPLDEGTGNAAYDVSGSGNDGAIQGATWAQTEDGNVLSFDGADDVVNCGSGPLLDLRDTISLSLWIKPNGVPTGEVGLAGKDTESYVLTYYHDQKVWWYIGSGGNSAKYYVPPDQWSHVVGTFDGAKLRLYRDGALVAEKDSACTSIPAAGDFLIGNADLRGFFNGEMADVKVYRRPLSAEEVEKQYLAGRGKGKHAGESKTKGDTMISFTVNEALTAIARYAPVQRTVQVQSMPITDVTIAGNPATAGGTTNYSAEVDDNSEVSLTALPAVRDGDTDYEFVRWHIVEHLAAHYPMNEGTGDVAHDVSGHENDGAVDGAVWEPYGDGYALVLDGIDDGVDCGNSPCLDITAAVTVSAWINPAERPPTGVEVGVAGKDITRYLLTYYHDGRCYFYIGAGGNDAMAGVPVGAWTYVVGTFDGTSICFYRNGELMEAAPSAYSTTPAGGTFLIGRRQMEGYTYKGKVSDVKVYSRALTADEVRREYEWGPSAYAGTPQPYGETTVTFTVNEPRIVVAEYAVVQRTLQVQSTPITGVDITGNPAAAEGTTDYSVQLDDNSEVTLTAPDTFSDYRFIRWAVNDADQPEGQTTIAFHINEDTTAEAVYAGKGDFDADGDIDDLDFAAFIEVYGLTEGDPGWEPNGPIADFDDDADVDFADFMEFVDAFGT